MELREKEILEKINDKTETVKVPAGLEPENIETLLTQQKPEKKSKKFRLRTAGVAAAACLVFIIGGIALRTSNIASRKQGSDGANTTNQTDTTEKALLATASDYDEVYEYLQSSIQETDYEIQEDMIFESSGSTSSMETSDSVATTSADMGVSEADYSDTNVREEGVGESDYVKTDGSYLYIRKNNMADIEIIDTRNPQMESVGSIHIPNVSISEFYIQDGKMMVLCDATQDIPEDEYYANSNMYTLTVTYDISTPADPKKLGEVKQSGSYYTSRASGDYLYTFSQFYADTGCSRDQISGYIPYVDGDAVAVNRILLPTGSSGNLYMVISSIHINEPNKIVDSKAVFSEGGQCYVSSENIYIYEYAYKMAWATNFTSDEEANSKTTIRKINYQDGILTAKAQSTINGYLDDSFCIDEYNGYLRTVVTVDSDKETASAVYVMNEDLEIIGKIEGLAKDERVYSARFMGDTGFFVTFRETDPLYSVDLSDPESPKIIGKLKIPGFSEYLHFYKDGLLLGIGMDVDEKTQVTGGVKLSMFDISDPSNVTEINKYVIKETYHSDVFYDYKAALVDAEKNIIGFSTQASSEMYYVFGYEDETGFTCNMEREVNGNSYGPTRGLYIKDTLYVVKGNIVESFNLKDYKKIDDIVL